MSFLKKYLPLLVTLIFLIILELIKFYPFLIYWLVPLLFLSLFFFLWFFSQRKIDKKFLSLAICPFFFILALLFFFVVLTPQHLFLVQIYILFASCLLYFLLKNLSLYLIKGEASLPTSLVNIIFFFNLLSVFLFFSSFYSLAIFPYLTFWLIELAIIIIISAIVYQIFWIYGFLTPKNVLFILVITLVLAELFLAIYFLPTSFYVNALFLTIFYYLLIDISYFFLLGKLNSKIIRSHFLIIFFILLVIILTMHWG